MCWRGAEQKAAKSSALLNFRNMLKKVNRLAKDRDIQTAFVRGRTFFNPYFTIKFVPSRTIPRFTVVVSTKVFKNAVARNRLKRILREYIRKNLGGFKNGDYVIIAKPKINKLLEGEAQKYFFSVMERLKQ
jgi:ribonuclease P protein component